MATRAVICMTARYHSTPSILDGTSGRTSLVGVWFQGPQRRANITGTSLLYGYIGRNIDH